MPYSPSGHEYPLHPYPHFNTPSNKALLPHKKQTMRLPAVALLLITTQAADELLDSLLDLSYPQREVKYRQVGLIPFRDLLSEAAAPSTRFSCERLQTYDAPKP